MYHLVYFDTNYSGEADSFIIDNISYKGEFEFIEDALEFAKRLDIVTKLFDTLTGEEVYSAIVSVDLEG